MIVCTVCGYTNLAGGGDFCRKCGGYLDWTGERVELPTPPEPEPEHEAPVKRGIITRMKAAISRTPSGPKN